MKKDVLFLCQFFFPEYISSATLPYDTALALIKAGFSVGVLCGYPMEYVDHYKVPLKESHAGMSITRLKYLQLKRTSKLGRLVNYFSFTLSVLMRLSTFKQYKSVIVYSNPPVLPLVAILAKKFYEIKIIFVSFDVYPEIAIRTNAIKEQSMISKVMNSINRSLYKNATKVVALSNDMKQFLLQNREGLQESKIKVIPNWHSDQVTQNGDQPYDNPLFEGIDAKRKLVVSYFGNMGTPQDLNTLLGAIRILKDKDISFVFAGHGNKIPILRKTIQEEHLHNVFLLDYLQGDDFQDALHISDVLVVSLANNLSGLAVPSKTYSYLMAGKPVISIMDLNTDISSEIIRNHAGYSVEVDDIHNLVKAIMELEDDIDLRHEMAKNARHLYESNYTTKISTEKYVEMFRQELG